MFRRLSFLAFAVCALASFAAAQDPRRDPYNVPADEPFADWDQAHPPEAPSKKMDYKYPAAMSVARPVILMPAKPQLVAPKTPEVQTRLDAFNTQRAAILKEIAAARTAAEFDRVQKLYVRLDEVRQEKLTLLREVGRRVVPPKPEAGTTDQAGAVTPDGTPASRPVLPLPQFTPKQSK